MSSPHKKPSSYVSFMRTLCLTYFLGGLATFFFPSQLIYLLNFAPKFLALWNAVGDQPDPLWLVPVSTLLLTLAALCFHASLKPEIWGYVWILLFEKSISTSGFLYLFIVQDKKFAYALFIGFNIAVVLGIAWTAFRSSYFQNSETDPSSEELSPTR